MRDSKQNIIVYVDYENLHYNFIKKYKNIFEVEFFKKLKVYLENKNYNVLDIIVYCNFDIDDMHNSYHQTKLQQLGLKTVHTCNNGKNYADVQIATDAVEQIYTNNIAHGVAIVSNDKDMTPLIKCVKNYKEFVILITTSDEYDKNLINFPTNNFFVEEILSTEICNEEINCLEENLYEDLNNFISDKFISQNKEPFITIDKYMNNTLRHNKVFEYEVYRRLKLLEDEKKIYIYRYDYKGKTTKDIYIVTNKYKEIIETTIEENSLYSNLVYENIEDLLQKSYEKFIKK